MWMQFKHFLKEWRLRLSSMKHPWFYDRMDNEYLKELRYDKRGY